MHFLAALKNIKCWGLAKEIFCIACCESEEKRCQALKCFKSNADTSVSRSTLSQISSTRYVWFKLWMCFDFGDPRYCCHSVIGNSEVFAASNVCTCAISALDVFSLELFIRCPPAICGNKRLLEANWARRFSVSKWSQQCQLWIRWINWEI